MDFVPVDQMDAVARSYFVHHRNQAEINKALMDLFRLVDFFLQSDESARDPLMSLRVVSEYMQRKGLVAPMPAELHDFYEQSTPETAQPNPLFELTRLMTSLNVPPGTPQTTRPGHMRSLSVSNKNDHHGSQTPRRTRANSFSESPATTAVPLWQESPLKHTFPEKNWHEPTVDTSCISSTREKIKAWLARPATQALRKWANRKAPFTPIRPQFHEENFEIIGREVHDAEEIATTRPSSPLYGVRVDTEQVIKHDPLPTYHARNKPLPQAPNGHRRSNSFSGISPRKMTSSPHEQMGRLTKRSEESPKAHLEGSPLHTRTHQHSLSAPSPIPIITVQPPTPPNSTQQSYEPPSPAGSTMSLEVPLHSPASSFRSLSSSSSHRVRRKPVPAYVDEPHKPSTTTPSSPMRTTPSTPVTPSPLRRQIQLHPSPKPRRDEILDSPHQQHMEELTQLAEGLVLGLSTNGHTPLAQHQDRGRMVWARDDDPNDLSQLQDVSLLGRSQPLSSRPQTANRQHKRDLSRCSHVSSVAPSLSTVSENSHSDSASSVKDGSEFMDCQESQGHDDDGGRVRRVTLPSGETLLLRGDDLEEWEMGEAIERADRDALQTYTREIDLACGRGSRITDLSDEASSVCGGLLADIAARRKPSIRSHGSGSGSRSSRRSRR